MRAFIALELPEEIKKEIGGIQKKLVKAGVRARWVKPQIAHLTLAFLGSITPDKTKPIEKILKEAAHQTKPIKLYFSKINCFPDPARARIVFIDLEGEKEKLNNLAFKIRKGLKKEKIWFDKKPFTGHITLGRIKKKKNLTGVIRKLKIKRRGFLAQKISLNKSLLTPSGPIYQTIREIEIQSPSA